tara:strand:- start:593 stop:1522 length:930 start_codon:yes stop_codon:yes gene_type:complete
MNGVQGNQAAQVRMFAHDAIPVALGAINPEFGITIDSGGYGYAVGNTIVLNTGTGTSPVAAQLKVTSIGKQDIINVQAQTNSQFYLNGNQLGSNKLVLIKGKTYTFYQKANSNTTHTLLFSEAANGVTPYTDGITSVGTPGTDRVITWTVASNTPPALFYYCSAHPTTMGGTIEIKESGDDFFVTYPNNNAVKGFEVIRLTTDKPFGKGYELADKVQPGTETYSTSAPSAFIGSIASIDLASTNERGACIYVGVKMTSMTAKMESGKLATFKDVAAGSFMPILVKQITTATPDGGTAGVLNDNDIVALY